MDEIYENSSNVKEIDRELEELIKAANSQNKSYRCWWRRKQFFEQDEGNWNKRWRINSS